MNFPNPYNNGRGVTPGTPIIGEQQVNCLRFEVQITPEMIGELKPWADALGLDGHSLLNYILTRGMTAIRQDLIYEKEKRDAAAAQAAGSTEE